MQVEKNAGFLESESEGRDVFQPLFAVIPVPLEQSVSYVGGTARGPAAILAASQQLEAWDGLSEPIDTGIATSPAVDCNGRIEVVLQRIEDSVQAVVNRRALPVVLGGEHTVSLSPIRVLARSCPEPIGIIQIDAHADLRASFEGTPFSHACVMRRALEECGCALLQFGVRALCREEVAFRQERRVQHLDGRAIPGQNLRRFSLPGNFPKNIYLTIDVDGLDPAVIPATGTPVPGGPDWHQTLTFIERVVAGRTVLGFDLVELAPRDGDHASDFTAAQLVYSVMGIIARNLGRN
ncbi:MAG: agmatinase [Pseudomonadota bacterium]